MRILTYLLFASLSFPQVTVLGHIHIFEIPLLLILILLPFYSIGKEYRRKLLFLDVVVAIYALFSLLSVFVGADSLYESARQYRGAILSPVLVYVVFRNMPMSLSVMRRGLYMLIPGILYQAVLFIRYYLTYGVRPPTGEDGILVSTITLSVLFCIGALIMFYQRKEVTSKNRYMLTLIIGATLTAALFVSFTRMTVILFLLLAPFGGIIWNSPKLRKLLQRGIYSILAAILIVMFGSAISVGKIEIEDEKEVQKSFERLVNIDLYLKNIQGRINFWGMTVKSAMKNPIFGSGAASYKIGHRAGTGFALGSSHNALVSALVVGGIPGLALLIMLIVGTYRCLNAIVIRAGPIRSIGMIILVGYTIQLFVAITNDLTAGRVFILFFFMALAARLSIMKDSSTKPELASKNVLA